MSRAPSSIAACIRVGVAAGAVAFCLQTVGHAEESQPQAVETTRAMGPTPYVVFAIGNVVDTVGTIYGKNHGNIELDPALNGGAVRIVAVKAISTLAFAGMMKLFDDHGHHTVAKILGYVGGGVTFGAGINDIRIAR